MENQSKSTAVRITPTGCASALLDYSVYYSAQSLFPSTSVSQFSTISNTVSDTLEYWRNL